MKQIKRLFIISIILGAVSPAWAEAPQSLTYQGRLKAAGAPFTGVKSIQVELCNAETLGYCYNTGAQNVSVTNGLFRTTFTFDPSSVDLGTAQWYLEIIVDAMTLSPREKLTSVPYALMASTASAIKDGIVTSAKLAAGSVTDVSVANGISASKLAGALPALDGSLLTGVTVADGSVTSAKLAAQSVYQINLADNQVNNQKLSSDPSSLYKVSDGTMSLSASGLAIMGQRVGIGTTLPGSALDVLGTGNTPGTYGLKVGNSGGTYSLYVRDDGNIGLAATPTGNTVTVGGDIYVQEAYGAVAILMDNPGNVAQYGQIGHFATDVWGLGSGDNGTNMGTPPALTWTKQGGVGIGTTNPKSALHVSTTIPQVFAGDYISDSAGSPMLSLRRARGTPSVPTAVQAGDALGNLAFGGYFSGGASGWADGHADITGVASQNWTDIGRGSFLTFGTTPDGATASMPRMIISSAGLVGVGTTNPAATMEINAYPLNGNALMVGTTFYVGNGRVGIGTTAPGSWLHVKAPFTPLYLQGSTVDTWEETGIRFYAADATLPDGPVWAMNLRGNWDTEGQNDLFWDYHSGAAWLGGVLRLKTDKSALFYGDVGFAAEVNHSISVKTRTNAGDGNSLSVTAGDALTGGGDQTGGALNLTAGAGSGTNASGGNTVLNGGAGSGTGSRGNVLLANSGGNVGIAVAVPSARLDVHGPMDTNATYSLKAANGMGYYSFFVRDDGVVGLGVDPNGTPRGNVGVGTTNPQTSLHVAGADAVILPVGATADRPAVPSGGMIRYNLDTQALETYHGVTQGWSGVITHMRVWTYCAGSCDAASGVYTPPVNLQFATIECVGGGGGGGGVSGTAGAAGGGGGGGGYARQTFSYAELNAAIPAMSPGGGGAGGPSGTSGSPGTASTVGGLMTCNGGGGGAGSTAASTKVLGGAGGTGSSADIFAHGEGGGYGNAGTGAGMAASGAGGSSVMAGGALSLAGTAGMGNSGDNYGGGGSGALSGGTGYSGGAGGMGIIIVTEFLAGAK